MKVRILEKIYHPTNNSQLSTPFRRHREEYYIKLLGTAFPYGCNDMIDSLGNLSSPGFNSVNVMNIFPSSERRKRSHGHRSYRPPRILDVSFDSLLKHMEVPLGIHHIRTKLYALPLHTLRTLQKDTLKLLFTDNNSIEYRLSSIILDICHHRLFKPVRSDTSSDSSRFFLKPKFINKGIDSINLPNILNHKNIKSNIPPYFKFQKPPIISYSYSPTIASKIFNYKRTLTNLDLNNDLSIPSSCSESPFLYGPAGHVITGDLSIIENDELRNVIRKGPKYREAQPIKWKYTFKVLMDSVEEYARLWAKREEVEVDTLSDWVKSIRKAIQKRIYNLKRCM